MPRIFARLISYLRKRKAEKRDYFPSDDESLESQEDALLAELSQKLGLDLRQAVKPARQYAEEFQWPTACCTFQQLNCYAHQRPVAEAVVEHIATCERCNEFAELIKKYSTKRNPEANQFDQFWAQKARSESGQNIGKM
jgi:hypothetical protein